MTVTKRLDFAQTESKISVQTSGYEFIVMTAKTVPEIKVYRIQLETVIQERLVIQVSEEKEFQSVSIFVFRFQSFRVVLI